VTRWPHRPFPYPLLHCRTLSQLLVALSNLLSIALRHVSSPVLPILPHLRMQLVLDLDVGQAFGPDSYHFRDAFMGADADRLYAALRQELDYVPRASMTFSIFGKTSSCLAIRASTATLVQTGRTTCIDMVERRTLQ
jgi:hypothetical protein